MCTVSKTDETGLSENVFNGLKVGPFIKFKLLCHF